MPRIETGDPVAELAIVRLVHEPAAASRSPAVIGGAAVANGAPWGVVGEPKCVRAAAIAGDLLDRAPGQGRHRPFDRDAQIVCPDDVLRLLRDDHGRHQPVRRTRPSRTVSCIDQLPGMRWPPTDSASNTAQAHRSAARRPRPRSCSLPACAAMLAVCMTTDDLGGACAVAAEARWSTVLTTLTIAPASTSSGPSGHLAARRLAGAVQPSRGAGRRRRRRRSR